MRRFWGIVERNMKRREDTETGRLLRFGHRWKDGSRTTRRMMTGRRLEGYFVHIALIQQYFITQLHNRCKAFFICSLVCASSPRVSNPSSSALPRAPGPIASIIDSQPDQSYSRNYSELSTSALQAHKERSQGQSRNALL